MHKKPNYIFKATSSLCLESPFSSLLSTKINNTYYYNSNNYRAVNIGQLKYVAKRFYDKLWELELRNPGSVIWPNGISFLSGGTNDSNHKYPWPDCSNQENYNVANVGQVKFLFSWSLNILPHFSEMIDSDSDGLDDRWEIFYFGNVSTTNGKTSYTNDGTSDILKFQRKQNPIIYASNEIDSITLTVYTLFEE